MPKLEGLLGLIRAVRRLFEVRIGHGDDAFCSLFCSRFAASEILPQRPGATPFPLGGLAPHDCWAALSHRKFGRYSSRPRALPGRRSSVMVAQPPGKG